jgi:MFS family permease
VQACTLGEHSHLYDKDKVLTAFSALNYLAIFTSITQRPIYNAAIGLCWGTGCILGPVIGGGFAGSNATWRW